MSQKRGRTIRRIGFVSTRVSGTDGVSLEVGKWAEILERMGYDCYYICGQSDRPPERTFLIEQEVLHHLGQLSARRSDFVPVHLRRIRQRISGSDLLQAADLL